MSDQAFMTLGTVIGWVAAIVGTSAVLADWIRVQVSKFKRRRCPKCWYDMSHTPGRTCSECGFTANRERTLYRSRKHWRIVGLAVLLGLGGHAASVTPAVKKRGLIAAIPTPAMILALPHLRPDRDCVIRNRSTNSRSWSQYAIVPTWKETLFIEFLHQRFTHGSLGWFNDCLINIAVRDPKYTWNDQLYSWPTARDRFLAAQRWSDGDRIAWGRPPTTIDPKPVIRTRPFWPKGVPVLAEIRAERTAPSVIKFLPQDERFKPITRSYDLGFIACGFGPVLWSDHLETLCDQSCSGEIAYIAEVRHIDYASHMLARRCIELPQQRIEIAIDAVDSCEQILTKVISPEFDQFLSQLAPTMRLTSGTILIDLDGESPVTRFAHSHLGMTIALSVTIRKDNEIVATGFAWFPSDRLHAISQVYVVAKAVQDAQIQTLSKEGDWRLTLTGDPLIALRNFDCNRYWHGEVTLPLRLLNQ